jgi:hypothetical protein
MSSGTLNQEFKLFLLQLQGRDVGLPFTSEHEHHTHLQQDSEYVSNVVS